ncbi:MAG: HAD family hydrolase [Spirochaetaceae bacterium]|nr:HAD family hydrolase [Spirochaetaceae bacterium]
MKKIVFLDIDGTLMALDQTVPQSAIEACRSARKNGHLLYICSGRQSVEIPRHVRAIGFDGVVSAGGASIEADGRNIFQAFMDIGTVTRLVDFFSARREAFALDLPDRKISTPALWALMESAFRSIQGGGKKGGGSLPLASDRRPQTGLGSYATLSPRGSAPKTPSPLPAQTSGLFPEMFEERPNFLKVMSKGITREQTHFYRRDVQKIIFVGRGGSFDELRKRFDGECEIFHGSIPLFGKESGEISPPGVHKGSAVEAVARYHGIPLSDTIAIGDSDNDRPMLERAGTGVAMGNASDELKALAAHVTSRLEDNGIMYAFLKLGLV